MSRGTLIGVTNGVAVIVAVWTVILSQPQTLYWGKPDAGATLPTAPAQPQWSAEDTARFIGCRAWEGADGRRGGPIPTSLVVVMVDASHREMSLAEADRRAHDDNRANDVWTIGGCWRRGRWCPSVSRWSRLPSSSPRLWVCSGR